MGSSTETRIKGGVFGLCALVAFALALMIAMPSAAYAARPGSSDYAGGFTKPETSTGAMGASWTVPTTPMTNTITKDGKLYKVLTTWAMAWSTSGPDYLGISNSSFYGNGENGNALVDGTKTGSQATLLGIWASDANEQPNAYNWNSFYNLYAQETGGAESDWACTTKTWDTKSGVWGAFKYRPEVIWLCDDLNNAQTKQYVGYINQEKYVTSSDQITSHTEGSGQRTTTVIDSIADPTAAEKAALYVDGDETYNPITIQPDSSTPYTFIESTYKLAEYANDIIAQTANEPGIGGATPTWQNVNRLPRATRYTESPNQIAMNIERLARGSVYYTLSKIADGTVNRKKVAFVSAIPGKNESIDSSHVPVIVYDYTEDISGGSMGSDRITGTGGTTSWSPLVVNQLGADGSLPLYATNDHVKLNAGAANDADLYASYITNPTATYSVYLATADDLLGCDAIYAPDASWTTVAEWQTWLSDHATGSLKSKATTIPISASTPYVTNGSNFCMDKLLYGAYAMDFIYPELFGNMENSAFWYNKIYHIKNDKLASALTWGFAQATLPAGTSLATLSFNANSTIGKYDAGLAYYNSAKGTDSTLKRVLASQALNGTTTNGSVTYDYTCFEPTAYWQANATTPVVQSPQSLTVKAKTATVKYSTITSKGKATLKVGKVLTVKNAKGAKTYAKVEKNKYKKITIAKNTGTVTVKKGVKKGTTYKVKVKVSAAGNDSYLPASKTVTIKVKVA